MAADMLSQKYRLSKYLQENSFSHIRQWMIDQANEIQL